MIEHKGIFLPDGEEHLIGMLDKAPMVDGRATYQLHKLEAAMKWVYRRRKAIDVGAHVGLWTVHLVKLFGHVHCFEPLENHRQCFVHNMSGVDNFTLHPMALGCEPRIVTMTQRLDSSGDSHISPKGSAGREVNLARLDDFELTEIDFIKIDCEGFELFVLMGGDRTIGENMPTVIVEQKPGKAQIYGLGETDAVTWLKERGYVVRKIWSGDFIMSPRGDGDALAE